MSIFSKRLKDARQNAGLSQEKLGFEAGMEEASASTRMNQYERGKHEPGFAVVERIAKVLNMPESYFYEKDDVAAWLLVVYHRMDADKRRLLIEAARGLIG